MKVLLILLAAFAAFMRFMGLPERPKRITLYNDASGTHSRGRLTRTAEQEFGQRYLLASYGPFPGSLIVSQGVDEPIGPIVDEPEIGTPTAIDMLGATVGTTKMVASEAIVEGDRLFATAAGKVGKLPAGAGTYWLVGRAAEAAAADTILEVIPFQPTQVTVV